MEETDLTPIQREILKALESLADKSTFTEFILAKKIRENTKITVKPKAGIAMADLERVVNYMDEKALAKFSLHLNSVNCILVKKDEVVKPLDADAHKRRLSSEKSMCVFTSGDLNSKAAPKDKKVRKNRSERKNIRVTSDFEDYDD